MTGSATKISWNQRQNLRRKLAKASTLPLQAFASTPRSPKSAASLNPKCRERSCSLRSFVRAKIAAVYWVTRPRIRWGAHLTWRRTRPGWKTLMRWVSLASTATTSFAATTPSKSWAWMQSQARLELRVLTTGRLSKSVATDRYRRAPILASSLTTTRTQSACETTFWSSTT